MSTFTGECPHTRYVAERLNIVLHSCRFGIHRHMSTITDMLWRRSKREEPTKRRLAASRQILCSAEHYIPRGIRQSPYKAMFGEALTSSFLSSQQIENIKTEEQLEEIANTSEKKLNYGHTENTYSKENIEEDLQIYHVFTSILTEKHVYF
ncbi:hypothetical protein TNCV_1042991 [Trichonephila clavipes]|nr:hypothetical protein TNCV_1042991 [Trichonephila clavipes]